MYTNQNQSYNQQMAAETRASMVDAAQQEARMYDQTVKGRLDQMLKEKMGMLYRRPDSFTLTLGGDVDANRAVYPDFCDYMSSLNVIQGTDANFDVKGLPTLQNLQRQTAGYAMVARDVVYKTDASTPEQTDERIIQFYPNIDQSNPNPTLDPAQFDSSFQDSPNQLRLNGINLIFGLNQGIVVERSGNSKIELVCKNIFYVPYGILADYLAGRRSDLGQ